MRDRDSSSSKSGRGPQREWPRLGITPDYKTPRQVGDEEAMRVSLGEGNVDSRDYRTATISRRPGASGSPAGIGGTRISLKTGEQLAVPRS